MKETSRIAIIDDDPIIRFGLKKMLGVNGFTGSIESYINGKAAIDSLLDKLATNTPFPDVIFLDINMPIMNGWEFLSDFLKLKLSKKIKINIVTSSIDPYDKNQWEYYKDITHHVITYNNKPIEKDNIKIITAMAS